MANRKNDLTRRSLMIATLASAIMPTIAMAQSRPPIKIGLILPFKGIWAPIAESMDRGYKMALDEVGNQVGGRPIEIIRADDELNPSVGVQRFNKLVQSDQVDIVAGVIGSNVAIALSELADRAKKPTVFVGAFADEVTGKYCSPYVARTSFSANGLQYNAGKYFATHGIKTVVTMGADYAAGHSWLDAFKRGFEEAGGKVVQEVWTPFQKTKDWGPALTQASNSGAQIIYSIYAGSEAAQVVKQHAEFGLRDKLPLIGDQWLFDEALWPAMGDLVFGGKFIASYFPGYDSPDNKKFVAEFVKNFGKEPDVNAALGYDNAKAILAALERLGGAMPVDGAQFISTLRSVEFQSGRGLIRFNKQNSALLEQEFVIEIVKGPDGKPTRKLLDTFAGADDLHTCTKSF
ncbi:ABC transporter substrate-binding protein [Bradyrhizobium sp. 23]|uniref:ABC transporter substrate-binding protein n=1 Tax=Bradyrhizobium sp. 23 TaxID=2782667 RepID=UPI001FFB5C46|nr:ABC transporter substrate-binding protein [Bradyrhizobium sp. 23]